MRNRLEMVYVETARANEHLQTDPDIGATLPMLSTAAGKAWLCKVSSEERDAVINRLRIEQPDDYAANSGGLVEALAQYEESGFCSNNRQWRPDAYGFAVPLISPVDANLFIFNCGVPAEDGAFESRQRDITPQLLSLGRGVEALMGLR